MNTNFKQLNENDKKVYNVVTDGITPFEDIVKSTKLQQKEIKNSMDKLQRLGFLSEIVNTKRKFRRITENDKKVLSAFGNEENLLIDDLIKATGLSKKEVKQSLTALFQMGFINYIERNKYDLRDFKGNDLKGKIANVLVALVNECHNIYGAIKESREK